MQDGVFEQAGLLAKLIASSAFPENSSGIIENAPLYSGGTAPAYTGIEPDFPIKRQRLSTVSL